MKFIITSNQIFVQYISIGYHFQASLKCERDLSYLTLSDQEQRELYEAAQIIQKAYRSYKGRSTKGKGSGKGSSNGGTTSSNQDSEARAAVLIQNYYRRYKQVFAMEVKKI